MVNGRPVHGLLHPEAGHICLKRLEGDTFPGVDALFGGASVEGLSSTPALAARKVKEIIWVKFWLFWRIVDVNSLSARSPGGNDQSWFLFRVY